MGKGDKKTKRGKIIIGSSGVSRSRKKKKNIAPVALKAEPKPKKEVEEQVVVPAVKAAPKKTAKKAEEHAGEVDGKPKAVKTKKKAAAGEAEAAHEESPQA